MNLNALKFYRKNEMTGDLEPYYGDVNSDADLHRIGKHVRHMPGDTGRIGFSILGAPKDGRSQFEEYELLIHALRQMSEDFAGNAQLARVELPEEDLRPYRGLKGIDGPYERLTKSLTPVEEVDMYNTGHKELPPELVAYIDGMRKEFDDKHNQIKEFLTDNETGEVDDEFYKRARQMEYEGRNLERDLQKRAQLGKDIKRILLKAGWTPDDVRDFAEQLKHSVKRSNILLKTGRNDIGNVNKKHPSSAKVRSAADSIFRNYDKLASDRRTKNIIGGIRKTI